MQDILVFWAQRKIPVDLHFIVRLLLRLEDVASVAPSIKVKILHLSTQVSLRPVPVAGRSGPGVTCFPAGMLPGPADRCSRPRLHEKGPTAQRWEG